MRDREEAVGRREGQTGGREEVRREGDMKREEEGSYGREGGSAIGERRGRWGLNEERREGESGRKG